MLTKIKTEEVARIRDEASKVLKEDPSVVLNSDALRPDDRHCVVDDGRPSEDDFVPPPVSTRTIRYFCEGDPANMTRGEIVEDIPALPSEDGEAYVIRDDLSWRHMFLCSDAKGQEIWYPKDECRYSVKLFSREDALAFVDKRGSFTINAVKASEVHNGEYIPLPPTKEELLMSELQFARERATRLENDNKLLLQRLRIGETMKNADFGIPLSSTDPEAVKLAQEACDRAHGIEPKRRASDGVKTDAGKLRWYLLPYDAVREVVGVLDRNAKPIGKYDERNWEKGIDYSRLYGATMRHLTSWFQDREDFDPETGIHHLAHAACNVLFLLAYSIRGQRIGSKLSDHDDRPKMDV